MSSKLPPVLWPYLEFSATGGLTLVTSVLDASANWLVLRCIYAALQGTLDEQPARFARSERSGRQNNKAGRQVILISFLRHFSLWTEIGKKVGLDLPMLTQTRRLIFIDSLNTTNSATNAAAAVPQTTTIRSHDLKDVRNALDQAIETCYGTYTAPSKKMAPDAATDSDGAPIMLIDGLDFLLGSQPSLTCTSLLQMIMAVRQRVHHTYITCSADGPLLHNSLSATPLEQEHRAFVAAMAHQSQVVMQLRSLDTGAAKDVSGVIRISRGGAYEAANENSAEEPEEGEWLYKVSSDGNVRIWSRGEG